MNDPMVKGIALVCDSPGGHVAGNFELVDKMYAMRGTKPIWGFAHEAAYSACYSIISCADPGKVWVSKTGGVGSIGVVTSHWDVSEAMKKEGYKITFIFAGKHKVDGNSYEALAPEVKDRIQVRIDALYDVFVSTVARNRGLDEQAVRDTEALTFTASEALSNGLADQIGPLDDALAAFAADLSSSEGDADMTTDTSAADQAALDTARAEGHAAGRTEGVTAGRAEGVTAERTRITAILASEEGKTRPIAALAAALDTEMTAEQAATFLGKLPAEGKTEAKSGKTLDEAMEETGGGAGVTAEGSDQGTDMVAQILANSTVATGRKYGEQKKPA
jgi:signal peptide peptidase SppA